jgi:hypothetical protein
MIVLKIIDYGENLKISFIIFKLNNKHHLNMNRPGTSISKAKVTKTSGDDVGMKKVAQEKLPTLQDYLNSRDWIGAIALL